MHVYFSNGVIKNFIKFDQIISVHRIGVAVYTFTHFAPRIAFQQRVFIFPGQGQRLGLIESVEEYSTLWRGLFGFDEYVVWHQTWGAESSDRYEVFIGFTRRYQVACYQLC